ncbi:MAG TPA: response regulator [Anaerolineae bacterium]
MQKRALKVLLIEDDEEDYIITRDLLADIADQPFHLDWIDTYEAALKEFAHSQYDVYLIDYRFGKHDGLELLREAIGLGCRAPLILLTGWGDRAVDIKAMEAGAADYLVKGQLGAPLLERSIRYAIERRRAQLERDDLIAELQTALAEVKTLSGLLPICASCKKIRDDQGYWQQVEVYLKQHSDAEFSHGFCPNCLEKLYPDIFEKSVERRQAILGGLAQLGRASLETISATVGLPENNTFYELAENSSS